MPTETMTPCDVKDLKLAAGGKKRIEWASQWTCLAGSMAWASLDQDRPTLMNVLSRPIVIVLA